MYKMKRTERGDGSAEETDPSVSLLRDVDATRVLSVAVAFARLATVDVIESAAGSFAASLPFSVASWRAATIVNIHNYSWKSLKDAAHEFSNTKTPECG
jgi:hypothetical protein